MRETGQADFELYDVRYMQGNRVNKVEDKQECYKTGLCKGHNKNVSGKIIILVFNKANVFFITL